MEWYIGSGIDDLVVPKDQELSDRLPSSPESWLKWGSYATQNFIQPNKCFDIENTNMIGEDFNFGGILCNNNNNNRGDSMETSHYSSSSSVCGGGGKEPLQRMSFQLDQQLDHLAGIEQLDDIYLNSLLEDLPRGEGIHKSFCFNSDDLSDEMILDSNNHNMGSSKYLKTHAFSPSSANLDKGEVSASSFTSCNTEPDVTLLKEALPGKVVLPSEQNNAIESVEDETSHEESVLEELKMAMAQFTDKTRICFRDALYRLAKNSKDNETSLTQNDCLDTEYHSPSTSHDINIRSKEKKAMESETNSIDRAVANLMFNRMDSNIQGFPVAEQMNEMDTTESPDSSSNQQHVHQFCRAMLAGDAEVPTYGRKTNSKSHKCFSDGYMNCNP